MIRNAFLAFAMNASNFVKHISNVTIVFFFSFVTTEMTAKGQSGTRSHSNMSFLQCTANGLVAPLQPYEDFRETCVGRLTRPDRKLRNYILTVRWSRYCNNKNII